MQSCLHRLWNLRKSKKGESLKLYQYYYVLRIYMKLLQDAPEQRANMLSEMYICMEVDYKNQRS